MSQHSGRLLRSVMPGVNQREHQSVHGWPTWWAIAGWLSAVTLASLGAGIVIAIGAREDGGIALLAGQAGLWSAFIATSVISSRAFGTGNVLADFGIVVRSGDAIKAILIGVALQLLVVPSIYLPLSALGVRLDVSGPAESLFDGVSSLQAALIAFGVVVVAPLAEELLFRGVLLRGLSRRFSSPIAIGASALAFAATHFQPIQFPALFVVGGTLAWLAHRTDGLGVPIWAHAAFNATTVVVLW